MTTWFVRKNGSDANAGTSAGTAFLTVGKAVSSVAAGDTVWIGAGIYRETNTLSTAGSNGNTITWNGDTDGAQTGDAGEVQLSAFTTNDRVGSAGAAIFALAGKHYQSFNNFIMVIGTTSFDGGTFTHDITINNCAFIHNSNASGAGGCITHTGAVDTASNWTISNCRFGLFDAFGGLHTGPIAISLPTTTTAADYNANIVIKNCTFLAASPEVISIYSSGANSNKGGGITIYNCSFFWSLSVHVSDTGISSTYPVNVYNCMMDMTFTALVAATTGQIIEDYNLLQGYSPRTNVTAGVHSVASNLYAMLYHFGQEAIWGGQPRPFGTPTQNSPLLGWGAQAGGPSVDVSNRSRPSGNYLAASGTATSGAAKTITDTTAAFPINGFKGWTAQITAGTGSGQTKSIASNTATVITVDGNFKTNPDSTSAYQVYPNNPSSTGKFTAGSTTTGTDSNADWGVNMWQGFTFNIDSGTGNGQSGTVSSNTATVLTFGATLGTALDSTSTYQLYKTTNVTTASYAVGALERHEVAQKEPIIFDTGSAIRLAGPNDFDFFIPVNANATVITIKYRSDANAVPTAQVLANGEIGVSASTVQTGTANQTVYTTLTIPSFTPTARGVVTLRVTSGATTSTGVAYFDTATVAG